ncbi:ABC transporter permease [Ornithinimicrobium pratense]|uniref:FtsX-like permease family protein n=1 Tax=Ornithinimicrobium pratense TaxID=2593973 RepID=A0A5J6V2J3_9MICO|nr:ABC transporter permease [Ornithinimicrobium pratense]QFG67486.1 FtsX-like permease family protein [Ornithinimicrobium pratense]
MGRHSAPSRRTGRRGSGGLTAGRLGGRQFTADPWVSLGLALLIGLVALLLTAVPRALSDVQSRQLVQDVTSLSAAQRDVVGTWNRTVEVPSFQVWAPDLVGLGEEEHEELVQDPWGPFRAGADRIRVEQPPPLRDVLDPAQMVAELNRPFSWVPQVESDFVSATFTLTVDPDLTSHVELVDGDWPALTYRDRESFSGVSPGPGREEGERETGDDVPEVMLSQDAADRLLLEVGDVIEDVNGETVLLSGTYRVSNPDDPRWQHVTAADRLGIIPDPDAGTSGFAAAFLSPQNRGALGQPATVDMRLWYPIDPTGITGRSDEVATLRTQLTTLMAQQQVLVPAAEVWDGPDQIPVFSADLAPTLDRIAAQQRATSSLIAVVAAGPLGVALAVAALGARLVVHRRRPALAMALARGAAPTQLRTLVALEGLVLGIPAAVLGHLGATLLLPGSTPWWRWAVTAVVALVPSVTLAASLDDASLLQRRTDLSGRSSSRWRWVVELALVGLAALSTWRLLDRGARGDDAAASGVDLLAAATPVLLALAACVITLRLYPLPLAALTRALRGRRSLTPFLGAARALRDPAGGLVPALAVVLGTAIALVSAVLLSTVTRGAEVAAWENNGAAIRVTGPPLTDDLRERLEQVDGVAAVGGIADSGQTARLDADGNRRAARVWLVDEAVQRVQADAPVDLLPAELFAAGADGRAPIATLRSLSADDDVSEGLTLSRVGDVEVVAHLPELPGAAHAGGVVVDRAVWEATGSSGPLANIILIGLADGADADQVAAGVEHTMGERSGVRTTVAEQLRSFTQAPVTEGLTRLFVGATIISGLLTVLAVVVVQLMGSAARARLLAVLRTLGLAPAQTRALTAWELAPLLVVSTVVGGLLGLTIPWVLLRGLDLTGLTGGPAQPALLLDPVLLALVLGAVVLTVLIAIAVSAWLAGRTNLAQALRVGEER